MKLELLLLTIIAVTSLAVTATAQKVEKFIINSYTYYGIKTIPEELAGLYKYEKKGEPIVEVNANGTGYFQVHGVKPYPVEYWIETDEGGAIQKRTGTANKNYQVVLILKYGSNGEAGWRGNKEDTFDRIELTMAFDMGYAIIMGERFRAL